MNKIKNNISEYITPYIRIVLGLIFIVSGVLKLTGIESFKYTIFELNFFNTGISNFIIYFIPIIEIILGIFFALGIFIKFVAIHLNILVFSFIIVTYYSIKNTLSLSCGCFGGLWDMKFTIYHLIILFVVFVLNIIILIDLKDLLSLEKTIRYRYEKINKMTLLKIFYFSLIFIGISLIVFALLFNFSVIGKNSKIRVPEKSLQSTEAALDIKTVTIDEAYDAYNSNKGYIFLDVRSLNEYNQGHIKGAISMPVSLLKERISEIPANKPIIAYCSGSSCNLSGRATRILMENGYTEVYDMSGSGVHEWQMKGYPFKTGN